MYPYFHILGRDIAAYGLCGVLAVALAVAVALLRCGRWGIKRSDTLYVGVYAAIGVCAGAALLYALIQIPEMAANFELAKTDFIGWLQIGFGGMVFYGGLLGGMGAIWIYARQFKMRFSPLLDLYLPSMPLSHAVGRIGCFLGGCCYGIPWSGPLAVTFTESLSAPNGVPLFPVQLLEAGLDVLLGLGLVFYGRKPRPAGRMTGIYLICYGAIRLFTEQFRGDPARKFLLGLSTSEWLSLLLIPVGILLSCLPRLRARRTGTAG